MHCVNVGSLVVLLYRSYTVVTVGGNWIKDVYKISPLFPATAWESAIILKVKKKFKWPFVLFLPFVAISRYKDNDHSISNMNIIL